jgi:hypothetical protein
MTTLQQIIDQIDPLFPVAGQDNNSQGFRDNFNYIKDALTTENSKVTSLTNSSVLTVNLTNGDPVDNDLAGSSINNGTYNNFHGVSFTSGATASTTIDVTSGSLQQFILTSNTSFTFRNWPSSGKYAVVRLHLVSDTHNSYTAAFYTEGGGSVIEESSFPSPLIVSNNGKHQVVEAWSYTGTTSKTVYIRYLGEF